jgi:diketogulonate reductase-like aldo/keto reductase
VNLDEIPKIGQGTWNIEGEPGAVEALRVGIELALTHIDTAEMYGDGRAEELVGEAIASQRAKVFLTSKVLPSNASYDGTLQACDRSLKRLKTAHLDLYLLHWKGRHPIGETMRAMERLIDQKLIRYAGVSNFDVAEVKQAKAAMRHHPLAANQVCYHLAARGIERKLIPHCAGEGIVVIGYTPFGQSSFPKPGSAGGKVLAGIAERHGRTVRQVILNFLTRFPHVYTIPKASNPKHTRENADGMGWQLAPDDIAAIDRAFPVPQKDVPLEMI